ncbi:hypothetical protein DY000_02021238 [Brassica cretica]|uniref:Uncharacterized protein n=1 Tax=Brassica cretica TaxID=69181 RepID=A0ABQ7E5H2_BRACR|nr:hypothetical protein DY000_02021238 [Brassica cretica]
MILLRNLRLLRASCSDPVGPVDLSLGTWRFRGISALTQEDLYILHPEHPFPSVEPFGVPSRSMGELRGNKTFVGREVLQFLDGTPCVLLFFQVKQQYFSVPGLGEYGLTWSHVILDTDWRRSMTRSSCSLPPLG